MTITEIINDLDNQILQYATGKNSGIKNNTKLKIDNIEYRENNYRTYTLNTFDNCKFKFLAIGSFLISKKR